MMMMRLLLALLVHLLVWNQHDVSSFVMVLPTMMAFKSHQHDHTKATVLLKNHHHHHHHLQHLPMDEIDTMSIMNTASYCVEEECTVDDEEALAARLQEQREILALRIAIMDSLTRRLQAKTHKKKMRTEDIMAVESLMRSIEHVVWMQEKPQLIVSSSQRTPF